jgi:hypothetical protein
VKLYSSFVMNVEHPEKISWSRHWTNLLRMIRSLGKNKELNEDALSDGPCEQGRPRELGCPSPTLILVALPLIYYLILLIKKKKNLLFNIKKII